MLTGSATMACENVTAADYYWLCDTACALGVPVSLDDPDSPDTVADLVGMTRRYLRRELRTSGEPSRELAALLELDRRFPR